MALLGKDRILVLPIEDLCSVPGEFLQAITALVGVPNAFPHDSTQNVGTSLTLVLSRWRLTDLVFDGFLAFLAILSGGERSANFRRVNSCEIRGPGFAVLPSRVGTANHTSF
jgi:hypothetical protein